MTRRYRSNQLDDMVGEMALTGLLVAGAIAVVAGLAIAELLRTPTEEKLRRLTPQEQWGEWISGRR